MPLPPIQKQYTYMPSGKARRELGNTLATEMGDIIDRLGPNHPDLNQHLLSYIENLDENHPEWEGFWDRGFRSGG